MARDLAKEVLLLDSNQYAWIQTKLRERNGGEVTRVSYLGFVGRAMLHTFAAARGIEIEDVWVRTQDQSGNWRDVPRDELRCV